MKSVSGAPLLQFDQISYRYADGSVGLDGCSLSVTRGSRNAVLGANGSGKTTLFQHANGLLRPTHGVVRYAGQAVDYGRSGLRELRCRVGMVFQNPDRQLFSASVAEDVSFGPLNLGLDEATVRQRVADALADVGLPDLGERPVHHLSFGQKKRVCIAGVLAMHPELLVLDEPKAGLDPAMQADLLAVLERLHRQGMSILLSTHDVDFAYRWADTLHIMAGGRCVASFPADDLPARATELTAAGLPLPAVLGLHARLAGLGLLPAGPAPRSTDALLAMLPGALQPKEDPCTIA
jgi:cobalt/nickel transport system ATP-binding protein